MTNLAHRPRHEIVRGRSSAEVYEKKDEPGVWAVESIDMEDDGDVFLTLFFGRNAKERAAEYADFKYTVS